MAATTYDHEITLQNMTTAFRSFAVLSLLVEDGDVKAARDVLNTADAIGFVIDPTKYRAALESGSLRRQLELVDLFDKTRAALKKLFPQGWPE